MAYGVIVSKTGQMLVETTGAGAGGESDLTLDRFQTVWGSLWVPGRLTLTRLHFTFAPNRAGRGLAMTNVNLSEVTGVEIGGGMVSKVMGLRTPRHVSRIRCLGAPALADQIARLVEDLKKQPHQKQYRRA